MVYGVVGVYEYLSSLPPGFLLTIFIKPFYKFLVTKWQILVTKWQVVNNDGVMNDLHCQYSKSCNVLIMKGCG